MSLLGQETREGGAKPNAGWRLLIRQRRARGGSSELAGAGQEWRMQDLAWAESEGAVLELGTKLRAAVPGKTLVPNSFMYVPQYGTPLQFPS